MIQLTRQYRFPAAHVLSNPTFSDAENDRVFGRCANPRGHGHDYGFEVTVTGPLDRFSGRVIDPSLLDAVFQERIEARFAHRLLNEDEEFRQLVPTTENFARLIHDALDQELAQRSSVRVVRVRVIETPRNSCEYGAME